MKKELHDKILNYNKNVQEKSKKANDMDVIVAALSKLPPGQLKKVLSSEVVAVLAKYGISL